MRRPSPCDFVCLRTKKPTSFESRLVHRRGGQHGGDQRHGAHRHPADGVHRRAVPQPISSMSSPASATPRGRISVWRRSR